MRKEYDFSKAMKNPYTEQLKKQVSINLDQRIVDFFKKESLRLGTPYQTLINLYLMDCVNKDKKLTIS